MADFQFSFGFRGPKFHYFSQNISELQFTFLFAWNCVLDRVLSMCTGTFSNTLLCLNSEKTEENDRNLLLKTVMYTSF